MHISSLLHFAFVAGTAVAAEKGTLGVALGDKKPDGNCKATSDYEADFDVLKSVTSLVRIYAANDCDIVKNIIPAAKEKQFKVVLGVWPDTEQSFNADFEALKSTVPGNEDVVEAITVGSEALYRETMNATALLERIQQVQRQFPTVTVGTVDSWNKFADGTADPIIQGNVDYFLVNGFAYWQGQSIDNAPSTYFEDMDQAKDHIEQIAGANAANIRFGTGETGWPTTGGTNYGPAIASTENAEEYYQKAICIILDKGIDVFVFEAFDETWKPDSKGDNGQLQDEKHWGIFTADRQPKFNLNCPSS